MINWIKIFENDDFIIEYDRKRKKYRVSCFDENCHWQCDCEFDEYNEDMTYEQ